MLARKLKEFQRISPHIDEIISPLKPLGVVGFFYVRIYNNGEFLDLTSNPRFAEHYFRNFFAENYPVENISDHLFIEQGVSLWELNTHNFMYQDCKNIFSYGNGITLCETHPGYKELYSFYSGADQVEMSQFYLRQLDFLRKFKVYFVEKAKSLIKEAERNKYLMPESYRHIESSSEDQKVSDLLGQLEIENKQKALLSPRELECLLLLSQGQSAKEIAYRLGLSQRTIENYIANMKSKCHCSKTSALIHMAMNLNLLT